MHSVSEQGVAHRRRPRNFGMIEKRRWDWPLEQNPVMPAPYDSADWAAVKALSEGRATPFQQQLALDCLCVW